MEERTLLAVALSILVLLGFQFLVSSMQPKTHPKQSIVNIKKSTAQNPSLISSVNNKNKTQQSLNTSTLKNPSIPSIEKKAKRVIVNTDLYKMILTEDGARIEKCFLKKYRTTVDPKSPPLNIVKVKLPYLPIGLILGRKIKLDLSNRIFKADKEQITLNKTDKEQSLCFKTELSKDITVEKIFTFHQGTYWIDLKIKVIKDNKPITATTHLVLYNEPLHERPYIFVGPAYCTNGDLEQVKLKHPGDSKTFTGPVDWMGYDDGYFLSAIIPLDKKANWALKMAKLNQKGLICSAITPAITGNKTIDINSMNFGLYFGPKEIDRLKTLHHHLAEAVNFGWFDPIAKPLLYILKFFNRYFHNYGVSIIVLTIIIKILFWPLTHKSQQSMKTMQKLQPKLKKLQEKYKDDKEKLNKELMQLYKTYKINPLGGCLPMLLQIPVFFALYKVLLQAIELRHAPFCLWINDLSAPDRLMIPGIHIPLLGGIPVLTLLMGVSMFIQQKMSPSSLDPMQSKMMLVLPVVFTVMFVNFPSGLVLYWLVNNILSIIQQYYINKFTD